MNDSGTGIHVKAPDQNPDQMDLLRAAIGEKRQEHYLSYLARSGGAAWSASWHWPAFFASSFWMLYRKLWAEWLIYALVFPIGAAVLGGVAVILFGASAAAIVYYSSMFAVSYLLVPAFANSIYLRRVDRLIRKARERHSETQAQIEWLRKKGGTSSGWIVLLLIIIVLGVVGSVAIPAYQQYVQEANATKG